jgi:hypothetical protein
MSNESKSFMCVGGPLDGMVSPCTGLTLSVPSMATVPLTTLEGDPTSYAVHRIEKYLLDQINFPDGTMFFLRHEGMSAGQAFKRLINNYRPTYNK